MEFKINQFEKSALYGLPYLQQLLYIMGIRPYMDYQSGITGIKRGISYQSLREETYVEAHPGYNSGSPSKSAIQRALKGLQKAGLINLLPAKRKLIIHCLLATQDNYTQNKAGTKTIHEADTNQLHQNKLKPNCAAKSIQKANTFMYKEAETPPVSGNNTHSYKRTTIPDNYKPSTATLNKADSLNCPTAHCTDELEKFISFYKTKGSYSCNWDATYLHWLLKAKQYLREKKNDKGKKQIKPSRTTNTSIIDRVFTANQALIKD